MEENNTQNKIKNIQKEDNLNLKQNKQIDKRKPTTPEHYSYFKLKNEKTDNRYLITVTNFPKKKKRNEISVDNIFQKKTEKKSSNIQIIDLTDGKDKLKKDNNLKDKKDKENKDKKEKKKKNKKDNTLKDKKDNNIKEKKEKKDKKEKEQKEKKEKEKELKDKKEIKDKKEKEQKEKKEKEFKDKKEKPLSTTTAVFSNRIPRKISFDNTTTSKSREKKRTNIKIEGNKLDTKISSEKKNSVKKIDKKNNKREEKKDHIKNNIKNREVSIELDTNKKSLNFSSDEKMKKDIKKISNKKENINLIKPSKETIELNLETPRDDSSDKKGISKENNIETIKDNQLETPVQNSNNIKVIKENDLDNPDENNLKKENQEDNNS